jgi:alpha-tubulin suppressor-like RCC1 family protein
VLGPASGAPGTMCRPAPVNVRNHNNGVLTEVRWISAGEDHSLAVAGSDSSVWAWGGNHCAFCLGPPDGQGGQLGDDTTTTTTDRSLAQHIGLPGTVQVSAGNELSAALTADG